MKRVEAIQRQRFWWLRLGFACWLWCLAGSGTAWAGEAGDWAELQERLRDLHGGAPDAERLAAAEATYVRGGVFGDLDYGAQRPLSAFREHLRRVRTLLAAHGERGGERTGDPLLWKRASAALDWWLDRDYQDSNWWNTYIGFPKMLAGITPWVAGRWAEEHPEGLERLWAYHWRVYEYLQDHPMGGGANLADMGYYSLVGAVMKEDAAWVDALIEESLEPSIAVMDKDADFEGWQVDGTLFAHGPQLHNGAYGTALLDAATQAVRLLWRTAWDLGQARVELLQEQLLAGVAPMIYGDWFDYNATGRALSRPGSHDLARGFTGAIPLVLEMEPSQPEALRRLRERILADGPTADNFHQETRAYYRSEFLTQKRAGSYRSVRMVSERTVRNERGNGEGIRNKYFGDGVQLTLVHGDEYDNAPVLWNYTRIPGTTVRQVGEVKPSRSWGVRGTAAYAGVLAEGMRGLAAMRLEFDGLRGWKSWFMTDAGLVALGSGLAARTGNTAPVNTSINQTRRAGSLWTGWLKGGQAEQINGAEAAMRLAGARWLWHREIGYAVLAGNDPLEVRLEERQGDWADVGAYSGEVKGSMLSLWLDHGTLGEPSGYAYVVRPGVTRTAWQRYVAEFPLRIVKRDGTVHAVENRETGVVYAAFFEPGEVSFSDGRSVRADGPLLVKVEERWGRCVVATADPLQRANTVALELSGWPLAEAGSDELFSWRVDLPQGNHTGATVVRYFSLVDGQLFDPDPVIALGDDWFRLPEGYLYRRMQPGWLFWAADQGWRYGRADRANSLFWWNPEEGGWFWRSAAVPDWRFAFADQRWERVGKR